jgi:predicted ArsR family transcriptional regulator
MPGFGRAKKPSAQSCPQYRPDRAMLSRRAWKFAHAARALGITFRAAQNNLDKLVRAGILQEVTGQRRGRIYRARDIVEIVRD